MERERCRALKTKVKKRSDAVVPRLQGEGEEHHALNTNEKRGALPLTTVDVVPCYQGEGRNDRRVFCIVFFVFGRFGLSRNPAKST